VVPRLILPIWIRYHPLFVPITTPLPRYLGSVSVCSLVLPWFVCPLGSICVYWFVYVWVVRFAALVAACYVGCRLLRLLIPFRLRSAFVTVRTFYATVGSLFWFTFPLHLRCLRLRLVSRVRWFATVLVLRSACLVRWVRLVGLLVRLRSGYRFVRGCLWLPGLVHCAHTAVPLFRSAATHLPFHGLLHLHVYRCVYRCRPFRLRLVRFTFTCLVTVPFVYLRFVLVAFAVPVTLVYTGSFPGWLYAFVGLRFTGRLRFTFVPVLRSGSSRCRQFVCLVGFALVRFVYVLLCGWIVLGWLVLGSSHHGFGSLTYLIYYVSLRLRLLRVVVVYVPVCSAATFTFVVLPRIVRYRVWISTVWIGRIGLTRFHAGGLVSVVPYTLHTTDSCYVYRCSATSLHTPFPVHHSLRFVATFVTHPLLGARRSSVWFLLRLVLVLRYVLRFTFGSLYHVAVRVPPPWRAVGCTLPAVLPRVRCSGLCGCTALSR